MVSGFQARSYEAKDMTTESTITRRGEPVGAELCETVKPSWEADCSRAERICRGTEGSNPSPSTRESDANLSSRVGTSSMPGNAAALVFFLFDLLHLDGEDLCPPI
jgi:ATP-dependent DNA ligase